MLFFIAALYNEQDEIADLIEHVNDIVDGYCIVDDGSTDDTVAILDAFYTNGADEFNPRFDYITIPHIGLPETVKSMAKDAVPDGSWILMLDADERLSEAAKEGIRWFFDTGQDKVYDYVYFNQQEIIDGRHVRSFQKAKLFRKEAITFPLNNIHADDQFVGNGTSFGWEVYHRKSSEKQVQRELEYLKTYKKLLDDGNIDQGRYEWLRNLHHYVK